MNTLVLVCDDNQAIHEGLKPFLSAAGMDMISAYDGEEALGLLKRIRVDIIIMDIMLPKMFGTDALKELRKSSDIPVIMISAMDREDDIIHGLALGADDYVTKPFSPRELISRIQTVLRRVNPQRSSRQLHFAELTVDLDAITVSAQGKQIAMSPNEVKLLAFLIENAGITLSRERILNVVWGYDFIGDTRTVDSQIKRLRKKLSAEDININIQSVYGVGFRLEALS